MSKTERERDGERDCIKRIADGCACTDNGCLRNKATLRFDFLHSFMVCAKTSAFLVQGCTNLKSNNHKKGYNKFLPSEQ